MWSELRDELPTRRQLAGVGLAIGLVVLFLGLFGEKIDKAEKARYEPKVQVIKGALAGKPIKLRDLTYATRELRTDQGLQRRLEQDMPAEEVLQLINENVIVQIHK